MAKSRAKLEYGDFQTPRQLANDVCSLLDSLRPASILEPTCGIGNFALAAAQRFPDSRIIGRDINADHVAVAQARASASSLKNVDVQCGDFFETEWRSFLHGLAEPILILGNPPWVTTSELGVVGSGNAPTKSNFQLRRGIDAITGKANFDISEWMVIRLLEACSGRNACLAMLVKSTVARKVLLHAWRRGLQIESAATRAIDALKHFGASVAACLLIVNFTPGATSSECDEYEDLGSRPPVRTLACCDGHLVADLAAYRAWSHLGGGDSRWCWRSGIKHDCSAVMEFRLVRGELRNNAGQAVDIEWEYLYPMLKSSEVAGRACQPSRWMLVPQRVVGEPTERIEGIAPKTWQYLQSHRDAFRGRKSTIYKRQPEFSVFGVGPYSFAPWKVAVSGFYKRLTFTVVGPHEGRPVIMDDTTYFLALESREEAEAIADVLSSQAAQSFYRAFIFWDAKRPITAELLRRLDLMRTAEVLNKTAALTRFASATNLAPSRRTSVASAEVSLF